LDTFVAHFEKSSSIWQLSSVTDAVAPTYHALEVSGTPFRPDRIAVLPARPPSRTLRRVRLPVRIPRSSNEHAD
jgi:hypothetical protein